MSKTIYLKGHQMFIIPAAQLTRLSLTHSQISKLPSMSICKTNGCPHFFRTQNSHKAEVMQLKWSWNDTHMNQTLDVCDHQLPTLQLTNQVQFSTQRAQKTTTKSCCKFAIIFINRWIWNQLSYEWKRCFSKSIKCNMLPLHSKITREN